MLSSTLTTLLPWRCGRARSECAAATAARPRDKSAGYWKRLHLAWCDYVAGADYVRANLRPSWRRKIAGLLHAVMPADSGVEIDLNVRQADRDAHARHHPHDNGVESRRVQSIRSAHHQGVNTRRAKARTSLQSSGVAEGDGAPPGILRPLNRRGSGGIVDGRGEPDI